MAAQKLPSLFNVNLLIHRGEEEKLYSKLLKWALSSGRFIVILVEMITIGAFVYRYKLDADLADLTEQINAKARYVSSLSEDEKLIKHTQFQLSTISKLKSEKVDYTSSLQKLVKIMPSSIKMTNLTFDRTGAYPATTLSMSGQTPSNLELSAFVRELKNSPDFSKVDLTNIAFDKETTFTITCSLVGLVSNASNLNNMNNINNGLLNPN